MAKALYLVILSRDAWWVDFEGKAEGPFASREKAALEAQTMARFHAHSGRDSEVLVPDERGRYWVVWSSANDSAARRDEFVPRRAAE